MKKEYNSPVIIFEVLVKSDALSVSDVIPPQKDNANLDGTSTDTMGLGGMTNVL